MNKKVIPEIQGDKVVLREWVGEAPNMSDFNSESEYEAAMMKYPDLRANAPT